MLQVIISPAKQMQVASDGFAPRGVPPLPDETARVAEALRAIERGQGSEGLQALWGVNDRLLAENLERLHRYRDIADAGSLDDPQLSCLVSPAIFSYVGIQFRSMAPDVLAADALEWLQGHLWVLSALYGCVRPFDAVQPYRLEMGAKLSVDGEKNLYAFWGDSIARAVCAELDVRPGDALEIVNLASVEYSKAVLPHRPDGTRQVTCVFGEDLRNGKPVQRSTASKIARGSMVRWMAERGVHRAEELKRFDVGYTFDPELSQEDAKGQTLVFMKG